MEIFLWIPPAVSIERLSAIHLYVAEHSMLVLTRKPGDGIVIGDNIVIKIIEMKNGAIRVGIDAPKDTKIYRQEVYEKISGQNIEALQWSMMDLDALSDNLAQRKKEK